MQPVEILVTRAQAGTRFSLLLISVFAVIAALLSVVGLHGVLATVVRERTVEIVGRMTLGAGPGQIFKLIVGQGLLLTSAGIATGLITALALTQGMTTMLVGVKPSDPATYATMALLFLIISATASWLPAWRGGKSRPVRRSPRLMTVFCAGASSTCKLKEWAAGLLANSLIPIKH